MSFVIFDTETTGFDVRTSDRLIELGAVLVENLQVSDQTFQSFADPSRPLPSVIKDLTGIVDADLILAPKPKQVILDFADFLVSSQPVFLAAYNLSFDLAIIERELKRAGYTMGKPQGLDVRDLARLLDPYFTHMNLDELSGEFGLISQGRHRALTDAMMTADLTCQILRRLKNRYQTWGEIYIAIQRLDFGLSI